MNGLQTSKSVDSDVTNEVSPAQVFDVLSTERRRRVLDHLVRYGTASVDDLTASLTDGEPDASSDQRMHTKITLVHDHLPRLDDANLVAYDPVSETAELLADPADLAPYLDLAADRDSGDGGR